MSGVEYWRFSAFETVFQVIRCKRGRVTRSSRDSGFDLVRGFHGASGAYGSVVEGGGAGESELALHMPVVQQGKDEASAENVAGSCCVYHFNLKRGRVVKTLAIPRAPSKHERTPLCRPPRLYELVPDCIHDSGRGPDSGT
jgi:hypothetical protein